MVRQNVWLLFGNIRMEIFDQGKRPLVQVLAFGPDHPFIDDLAVNLVVEPDIVPAITAGNQPCAQKFVQGRVGLGQRPVQHRSNRFAIAIHTNDRQSRSKFATILKPVQTLGHTGIDRLRYDHIVMQPVQIGFSQGTRKAFQHQRVAATLFDQLFAHGVGQHTTARRPKQQRFASLAIKGFERQGCRIMAVRPDIVVCIPRRGNHHNAPLLSTFCA